EASTRPDALESSETEIRRRYVTCLVRQRLHQQAFRERVLAAYGEHCAICRLRHHELLEAAHIAADTDPEGEIQAVGQIPYDALLPSSVCDVISAPGPDSVDSSEVLRRNPPKSDERQSLGFVRSLGVPAAPHRTSSAQHPAIQADFESTVWVRRCAT